MSRNSRVLLWSIAILLLLVSPMAFAATQNAVVYGTVYDSIGNPLSGVEVALENPAIGFSRNATTGSDGSYTFPEVPPGLRPYSALAVPEITRNSCTESFT